MKERLYLQLNYKWYCHNTQASQRPGGLMDKASASGAEDCGFKSHLGREEAAGFKRKNFCGVQSVVRGLSAQFHEDHKQYGSVPFADGLLRSCPAPFKITW